MIRILKNLLYIRYSVSPNEKLNLRKLNSQITKTENPNKVCGYLVNFRSFLFGLFYFKREVKNDKQIRL